MKWYHAVRRAEKVHTFRERATTSRYTYIACTVRSPMATLCRSTTLHSRPFPTLSKIYTMKLVLQSVNQPIKFIKNWYTYVCSYACIHSRPQFSVYRTRSAPLTCLDLIHFWPKIKRQPATSTPFWRPVCPRSHVSYHRFSIKCPWDMSRVRATVVCHHYRPLSVDLLLKHHHPVSAVGPTRGF